MAIASLQRAHKRLSRPKFGLTCAAASTLMCGLGGVLCQFAPNFYHRRVWPMMHAPRWHHLWADALLIVVAFWCIHALLALRNAIGQPSPTSNNQYRALWLPLGHLATVLAFGAYAWLVIAAPSEDFVVTAKGTEVHGEFYRLIRVEHQRRGESNRPRSAAWIERTVGANKEEMRIERGQWWLSRIKSYQLAFARTTIERGGAVFRHGHDHVTLHHGETSANGLTKFFLRALHSYEHRHALEAPRVELDTDEHQRSREATRAEIEIDGHHHSLVADPEWAGENAYLGERTSPAIIIRVHRELSLALGLLTGALLAVTVLLAKYRTRSAVEAAQ